MELTGALNAFKPRQLNGQTVVVDHDSIISILRPFVQKRYARYKEDYQTFKSEYEKRKSSKSPQDARLAKMYEQRMKSAQDNLTILKQRWGGGKEDFLSERPTGIEAYVSRMHGLTGYKHIYGVEYPGFWAPTQGDTNYIVGHTTEVIVENDDGKKWTLGEYQVFVPLEGTALDIHWIPLNAPDTHYRHPHHLLSYTGAANTCWGTFNPYVMLCAESGDIIPLLALSSKFVHTYNPKSPLRFLENIPHAKRI